MSRFAAPGLVLRLIAMGMALAISVIFGCGKLISGMLCGVSPLDPLSIVAASAILLIVPGVAGFFPARRASLQYPMSALRCERCRS